MKKFKKVVKLFLLVLLIFLATIGIGISGGIPINFSKKRRLPAEVSIELIEPKEEDTEVKEFESIQ
ncbi:MAG: hypothetical protein P1U56_17740 [Saprospiraceae bacterium]|nr:hypothetical protein [Saprospiraceae bacterium]